MNTIQTILDTEAEAKQVIDKAHHKKSEMLEQARFQKQEELARHRNELAQKREQELNDLRAETETIQKTAHEKQEKERARIEETARGNHTKAVDMLLKKITAR